MGKNCDHYWEPTFPDSDGQPIFKNYSTTQDPMAHATCANCQQREWFTKKEWLELTPQPNQKEAVETKEMSDKIDAERYRWLRQQHKSTGPSYHVRNSYNEILPHDLDAAIDAAMKNSRN